MSLETLPKDQEIVIRANMTWEMYLRWVVGGEPLDWTGWGAWLSIGLDFDNPVSTELTVGDGIEFQEKGVIYLYMSPERTARLASLSATRRSGTVTFKYNLVLQDPLGKKFVFIRGDMMVEKTVLRP